MYLMNPENNSIQKVSTPSFKDPEFVEFLKNN